MKKCTTCNHVIRKHETKNKRKCDKCFYLQKDFTNLPFSMLTNNDLFFEMHGLPTYENQPSFSIQSLLDEMPGHKDDESDFLSNSVSSKYYTPAEFLTSKFPKGGFSILHLNIASLQKHVDELRSLLFILNCPFDFIGITETRLSDSNPILNLEIEGYKFIHTPTTTKCGGASIYIRNDHRYEIINDYSKAIENVSESIFIEIANDNRKPVTFGCIYRHPNSVAKDFSEYFLDPILQKISNEKKTCVLVGDFNFDLLKYESHLETSNFYDLLAGHSYRPLILHPSRVTSKSNTLIDNIFINDLTCSSVGGNITSSISDHFLQFRKIDIFDHIKNIKLISIPAVSKILVKENS